MLVTFKCNAYENITMFGDVAIKLLTMLGHSGAVPGAILAEDVPHALQQLKNAVAGHKENQSGKDTADDSEDQRIDLSQRAYPMIEMLTHAAKAHSNIMWDKS